ncbi:ABC transporter permease [Leptolyngbya sp. AN02str]|uniref:ABC transporter permease n=1 Tax=Leptolyngbya sp. AN02str TaxID=3423363 RepID=UPI003D323AC7
MSLGRVFVIATNVFREVIRDRILYLVGLFAIGLVAIGSFLPQVSAGTEDKILLDLGLAAINLVGLVIAIFLGTGLINKEIERRTVYVLIAKPVSRIEFIVGKHLGLSAVLALLVAAMTLILFLILQFYQVPYPMGSLLITEVFQFLELSLITAVAILFGVFSSSLLATLLTVGVYLMGQLSRDLLKFGEISQSAGLQRVTEFLYLVLPDLARLNLKNQAIYGVSLLPEPIQLLTNGIYAVVYIALLLAIATVIFSKRQF